MTEEATIITTVEGESGDELRITEDGIEVYEVSEDDVLGIIDTDTFIEFGRELENVFDDEHEQTEMGQPDFGGGLVAGMNPIFGAIVIGIDSEGADDSFAAPPTMFEPDTIIEAAEYLR